MRVPICGDPTFHIRQCLLIFVLGGGMSKIERLYQTLPKMIPEWIFGKEFSTPIAPAKHGDSSGVRGAAWLWNDDLDFDD